MIKNTSKLRIKLPIYTKLRQKAFSQEYALPYELIKIAETEKTHSFLTNPIAITGYMYLVNYINRLAKTEFADKKELRILDWGCGKGHITYLLKKSLPEANIISCDVSDELAKDDSTFGQKTPIIDAFMIEVVPLTHNYQIPFADNSFDIVISIGVLEHVPNDQASLKEINRILNPNGLFFCAFLPYIYSWTQKISHLRGNTYHDRLYSWQIVKQLLFNSGFDIADQWHRCLLPKNNVHFPLYKTVEKIDQWLCNHTLLKYLATNIEFVARKI